MRRLSFLLLFLLTIAAAGLYGCACDCASPSVDLQVRNESGAAPAMLTGFIDGEPVDCAGDCGRIFAPYRDVSVGSVDVDLTDGTETFLGTVPVTKEDTRCCPDYTGSITLIPRSER